MKAVLRGFENLIKRNIVFQTIAQTLLLSSLCFAYPRLVAEFVLLPGTVKYQKMVSGDRLSEAEKMVLIQSRREALEYEARPQSYFELGYFYIHEIYRAETTYEKAKFANLAIENLQTGLNLAPMNGRAWALLSSACMFVHGNQTTCSIAAWRNSIKFDQFESTLLVPRTHLGILLLNGMSLEDVESLKTQIQFAFRHHNYNFAEYVKQHHLKDSIVELMGSDSEVSQYLISKR